MRAEAILGCEGPVTVENCISWIATDAPFLGLENSRRSIGLEHADATHASSQDVFLPLRHRRLREQHLPFLRTAFYFNAAFKSPLRVDIASIVAFPLVALIYGVGIAVVYALKRGLVAMEELE